MKFKCDKFISLFLSIILMLPSFASTISYADDEVSTHNDRIIDSVMFKSELEYDNST